MLGMQGKIMNYYILHNARECMRIYEIMPPFLRRKLMVGDVINLPGSSSAGTRVLQYVIGATRKSSRKDSGATQGIRLGGFQRAPQASGSLQQQLSPRSTIDADLTPTLPGSGRLR